MGQGLQTGLHQVFHLGVIGEHPNTARLELSKAVQLDVFQHIAGFFLQAGFVLGVELNGHQALAMQIQLVQATLHQALDGAARQSQFGQYQLLGHMQGQTLEGLVQVLWVFRQRLQALGHLAQQSQLRVELGLHLFTQGLHLRRLCLLGLLQTHGHATRFTLGFTLGAAQSLSLGHALRQTLAVTLGQALGQPILKGLLAQLGQHGRIGLGHIGRCWRIVFRLRLHR